MVHAVQIGHALVVEVRHGYLPLAIVTVARGTRPALTKVPWFRFILKAELGGRVAWKNGESASFHPGRKEETIH